MRWFRFPREFFVSGVTCSAPRIALETLLACFAVAWRHRESSPLLWSCWARYSVVLRLWHGLGLLWLVSLWESSGPARVVGRSRENGKRSFRDVQAMFKRVRAPEEERGRVTRASFLTVRFLDIPKGGWSNQSVGTGRSPACTAALARHFFMWGKITCLYPCYSNSYRVYTFTLSPHSLSYWFIQFCNHS